jgi:hypothetical protein
LSLNNKTQGYLANLQKKYSNKFKDDITNLRAYRVEKGDKSINRTRVVSNERNIKKMISPRIKSESKVTSKFGYVGRNKSKPSTRDLSKGCKKRVQPSMLSDQKKMGYSSIHKPQTMHTYLNLGSTNNSLPRSGSSSNLKLQSLGNYRDRRELSRNKSDVFNKNSTSKSKRPLNQYLINKKVHKTKKMYKQIKKVNVNLHTPDDDFLDDREETQSPTCPSSICGKRLAVFLNSKDSQKSSSSSITEFNVLDSMTDSLKKSVITDAPAVQPMSAPPSQEK